MFVERSAARIRLVRTLYVLACLLPTLGLVGWAVYRSSSLATDPLLAGWSRSLGFNVTAATIEHVRPAVLRLHDVAVEGMPLQSLVGVEVAEVETRSEGTLLRLPSLTLDAAGVSAVATLSLAWLTEPIRFPEGGVIEVEALAWRAAAKPVPLGGWRIEYVVAEGGRAIRIRREPADEDELRLRAVSSPGGPRLEAELRVTGGLPAPLLAAVTGWLPSFGPAAEVRGSLQASATAVPGDAHRWRWQGVGEGLVTGVDLSELAAAAGQRCRGEGLLRIEDVAVEANRITAARWLLSADEGELGRGLVERLVTVFGCRLGEAAARDASGDDWLAGPPLVFDQAAVAVSLDRAGVILRSPGSSGSTLVRVGGQPLLEAAPDRIGFDRFAWLFAPAIPGVLPATIPASARAIEVLSRLPEVPETPAGRF